MTDDEFRAELERVEAEMQKVAGLSPTLLGRYRTRLVRHEDGTVTEESDGITSGYAVNNLLNAARSRVPK